MGMRNKKIIFLCMMFLFFGDIRAQNEPLTASWTVIGAGPAGIAIVGVLLDCGVSHDDIIWVDQEFNVGRMGKYYFNVPGNARVKTYTDFLRACSAFALCKSEAMDELYAMPCDKHAELKQIIQPLMDITCYLRTKIRSLEDTLISLDFQDDMWLVGTQKFNIKSNRVVLATGSHPREVTYEGIAQIPLDLALDKKVLASYITPEDTIGVIGSAHSALLVVKYLTELPVKHIINFYKKPIVFTTQINGGYAWPESGLKGELAAWLKTTIAHEPPCYPKNLIRVLSDKEEFKKWSAMCSKIIFAGGFERNTLPPVNGSTELYAAYDNSSGVIGKHLFGVGIAFPEKTVDVLGNVEYGIGLGQFMTYIQKIMPEWMKNKYNRYLCDFNDLFNISVL
jgi:hypothetical protein